jgi:hypothetical protein
MSNQTEELLRVGMERFTADVDVPPGLAAKAARHRRRRKRAGAAGAVICAASVAGVTAVVVAGAGAGPGQHAQTAAYVRAEAALGEVGQQNFIEYTRETLSGETGIGMPDGHLQGDGTVASWTYHGYSRMAGYDPHGHLADDYGSITTGRDRTTISVSFQHKTWWREKDTLPVWPSVTPTPESSCEEATVIDGPVTALSDWAAEMRAALRCGQYVIAGTQRVDGVQAVELKPVQKAIQALAGGPVPAPAYWVDPATYLPVRYLATFDPPVFKAHGTIQADFRWLRPTRANLAAAFNVPIPAGFKQVPPPQK